MNKIQNQITLPGPLLDAYGELTQVGWARQPLLDNNLEDASFYTLPLRPFQRFRTKRWDYYAVFTPQRFFSATIADLGYAGNIFVYTLDFSTLEIQEEGLVVPFARGVELPRNSDKGTSSFANKAAQLTFTVESGRRNLAVSWPGFHDGRGIQADLSLICAQDHESMNIVIPIQNKRFYYNRKINCLPVEGSLQYGDIHEKLDPQQSLGSLDWGSGVWAYQSFWNWASASGFLPDGRTVGLNLGSGFGDTSNATENCLVLDGKIHKLDQVAFLYDPHDFHQPWRFADSDDRLSLEFIPFKERLARTDLKLIFSEVHQMFGKFSGHVISDDGEIIKLEGLIGFAEEHLARW